MKLRNKQTGEVVVFGEGIVDLNIIGCKNVAEMIEAGWTDYEEPKGYYYVTTTGLTNYDDTPFCAIHKDRKEIGNYFDTREQAELAVRKLKAWKRLKDGGITFKNWTINQTGTIDCFATWGDNIPPSRKDPTLQDDLDLLFGGDE